VELLERHGLRVLGLDSDLGDSVGRGCGERAEADGAAEHGGEHPPAPLGRSRVLGGEARDEGLEVRCSDLPQFQRP
jgi:hypothetical protein